MSTSRPSDRFLKVSTWEEKAQQNPLYAVMSMDQFANSDAQPTSEELECFFADGEKKVNAWIYPWLQETKTEPDSRILEFGCGMGRLIRGLLTHIAPANLYGVDISNTMISHAQTLLSADVTLKTLDQDGHIPFPDEFFDRIFSYAVFQHIRHRSTVNNAIAEIARVLKVGGSMKLNFEMVYPPRFGGRICLSDTYAFEGKTLIYGWSRRFGVPLWRLRIQSSNNWAGIRLGYRQLVNEFRKRGIEINGICRDASNKRLVWFYGNRIA